MKVLKTLATIEGVIGLVSIDTIEYDGGLWLVPKWLDNLSKGYSTPERIIRLDFLAHDTHALDSPFQFSLRYSIPKEAFDGPNPNKNASAFVVLLAPDIRFPIVH